MFIATDDHGITRHIRAAPCCSDAIINDYFNEKPSIATASITSKDGAKPQKEYSPW